MGERVLLGAIAGAHGVRGEVRLKSFCDRPEAIADYGPLDGGDGRLLRITALTRPLKGGFAARIEGIDSREAAEALRGTRLYLDRAALPEPDEEEYYHADLIGLDVVDLSGLRLGRIRGVAAYGAGDLLDVAPAGGGDSVLVPFTREIVPRVAPGEGIVVVDPPAGLFAEAPDDD